MTEKMFQRLKALFTHRVGFNIDTGDTHVAPWPIDIDIKSRQEGMWPFRRTVIDITLEMSKKVYCEDLDS
jgi:hypothetical protein